MDTENNKVNFGLPIKTIHLECNNWHISCYIKKGNDKFELFIRGRREIEKGHYLCEPHFELIIYDFDINLDIEQIMNDEIYYLINAYNNLTRKDV